MKKTYVEPIIEMTRIEDIVMDIMEPPVSGSDGDL